MQDTIRASVNGEREVVMMYKLVGHWSSPKPEEKEKFEAHYVAVHLPLASAVPRLRKIVTTVTADGFAGAEPPFYRVAEMCFDSPEEMAASSESDAWHEMHTDAVYMCERFGVSLSAASGWETVDSRKAPQ